MKRVLTIAGVVFALVLTTLGFASTASAGASICGSGYTQVWTKYSPSPSYGQLVLYYNPASGGTNCLVTYRVGAAYGNNDFTEAAMRIHGTTYAPHDAGYYSYYAGPVKISGTNGHCMDVFGEVQYGSYDAQWGAGMNGWTPTGGVACG